jgi:glucarate dehydratase
MRRLEMACMDVAGKALGVRACDLIGGALRESIPFASYLFYRYGNERTVLATSSRADALVKPRRKRQKQLHGFKSHKLKGGVFAPEHDVEVFRQLPTRCPGDRFRLDPNSVWSVEDSIWVAKEIEHIRNDYFEDPCFGLEGMRRLRDRISIPTATNTVVVNFEQLASCIKHDAVDVILLDTTFWGGLRQAYKAGQVLETFQFGASVHSSGELGIQLASMLHLGAALPNMSFAADAHYHHLLDDIIVGGKLQICRWRDRTAQGAGARRRGRSRQAGPVRRLLPRGRRLHL